MFLVSTSGLNAVSAENETQTSLTSENEEESKLKIKSEEDIDDEIVSASEDGHFNIEFDDGYNGYCINYGDHEAKKGQNFTVQDTSYATNENTGKSVANYLKIYFVDYYDEAMKNEVVTQHTIWHFTDNFTGWRLNYTMIEEIKNLALTKTVPDQGAVRKINNTTEAVFSFEVLASQEASHQNFFAYNVIFRNIEEIIENITGENSTNPDIPQKNETENITQKENKIDLENESTIITHNENEKYDNPLLENNRQTADIKDNDNVKENLNKHVTGYNFIPALIILLFGTILLIKYARD